VKVASRERHTKRTLVFALHSSLTLVVSNYKVYTRVRAAGRDKTLAYYTALLRYYLQLLKVLWPRFMKQSNFNCYMSILKNFFFFLTDVGEQ
jgi:hypothetical protein